METRNVKVSLDTAKIWYEQGGEFKEMALSAFTEAELIPVRNEWESKFIGKEIDGVHIQSDGCINKIGCICNYSENGTYKTEKLDAIFEKYQEAEGVTSIKIAKPMFRLLNNINIDDSDMDKIKPLISKMNGLKILILEKPEKAEPIVTGKQIGRAHV